MSGSKTEFVLDSNPFIEAKQRYYGFDLCPGFWKSLVDRHKSGRVCTIDRVFDELAGLGDELTDWISDTVPDTFVKQTRDQKVIDTFRQMLGWVSSESFSPEAVTEFASVADGWVIAYASVNKLTVVTHEGYSADAKARVPMPNVCLEFNVPYCNTFDMLRTLDTRFVLKRSRAK